MAGESNAPDPGGPSPYPEPDITERIGQLRQLHNI
jgi:hypothetical protein